MESQAGPDAAAGGKDLIDVNEVKFEQEGVASDSETEEGDDRVRSAWEKEARSPVFETRLERAQQCKEEGNQLFKLGEWASANTCYDRGLYHSDFDEMQYNFELLDQHREQVDKVRIPLLLNAAACNLKLGKVKTSIELCNEVFKYDKDNVKAFFRRGQAYQHAKKYEKAREDFLAAVKLEPNDKLIRKSLRETTQALREEESAGKMMWKGKLESGASKTSRGEPVTSASSNVVDMQSNQLVSRGVCKRMVDFFLSFFIVTSTASSVKNNSNKTNKSD